jgi:hypothetical protein
MLDALPEPQRGALDAALGLAAPARAATFLAAAATLQLLAEAAEEQAVLCAVDDLQWLDRPSADALVFAARRLDAEAVAMLFALRDGEPVPAGLRHFPALELGPLDRADARELLERGGRLAPDERERLLDAGGGVPLALLELPRGPLGAGPPDPDGMGPVERAFAGRVAALPERARRAVLLAAADDDAQERTALSALSLASLTPADLAPAEAGGLLWLADGSVAFRHPLVRSAAYRTATSAERCAAHDALAQASSVPRSSMRLEPAPLGSSSAAIAISSASSSGTREWTAGRQADVAAATSRPRYFAGPSASRRGW